MTVKESHMSIHDSKRESYQNMYMGGPSDANP